MDHLIEIGVIVKPHGIKGAVSVHLHNSESTVLSSAGLQLTLEVAGGAHRVVDFELLGRNARGILLRLDGVRDRSEAQLLRGCRILVDREVLDPPQEGEFYYADLMGCQVMDEAGQVLGEVHDLYDAGASDVLVIRGELEYHVPLVDQWVSEVLPRQRRILLRDAEQWISLGARY